MNVERIGEYKHPSGVWPGRIVKSAVLQDGVIWTALRHGNIIPVVWAETGKTVFQGQQGFWTENGWFLRRKLAKRIALRHGQIEEGKVVREKLHSEDLW